MLASYEQLHRWMTIDHHTDITDTTTTTATATTATATKSTTATAIGGPATIQGTTANSNTVSVSVQGVNVALKVSVELAVVLRYRAMCEQYHADRHYRWVMVGR